MIFCSVGCGFSAADICNRSTVEDKKYTNCKYTVKALTKEREIQKCITGVVKIKDE